MALWTRIRDQFDFFPWYALNEAARLRTPKAPLERHRAVLRDFLAAGPHDSTAYAASFRFEALSALQDLRVPTHVMARETDLLFSHLQRLGALPGGPDAWADAIRARLQPMQGDAAPPAPADRLTPSPSGQKGVFEGDLLRRCYGDPGAQRREPVLLLHDTPSSALAWGDEAARLATDHLGVVPELPSHGVSPDVSADSVGLDGLCSRLDRLYAAALSGAVPGSEAADPEPLRATGEAGAADASLRPVDDLRTVLHH